MKINSRNAVQFLTHVKNLEALGVENGYEAYDKLFRLETKAHRLAEDLCNWLDTESEESDKRSAQIHKAVAKIFGGKTPMGFFINYDPRGYSLKIKEEQNRIFVNSEDGLNHDLRVINYTDFGGYGILAPDFGG